MSFHQPLWLFTLLLVPFLALLRVWSHVSTGRGGTSLVSSRLRSELIIGASQGLRWAVFCLNLLALACLIVAMARPQWGFQEAESVSEGRNLIVAIDTSRSMLATDILPDRLTRAKLAAKDIIAGLPDDRIGLIAFAGKAFLQAPLTVDHDAILESIDQLDTEIIPRGGTNLEEPVKMALESFKEAESRESALILFSDGEDLEGEEKMLDLKEQALELGMIIVAIGVGTETGSIIPEPDDKGRPQPGLFVTDDTGNVVRTRLDPRALQDLSAESGAGVYVNLGGTSSITMLVKKSIDSLSSTRMDDQARRVPIERFMWPLGAAVLLWVVAFLLPASSRAFVDARNRRAAGDLPKVPPPLPVKGRSITCFAGSLLLSSMIGHAADTPESVGFEALQNRDFPSAITHYESELATEESENKKTWLNLGLGAAAYLDGDYEKAQQSFGRVLAEAESREDVAEAHFNLGNSLFRKGQVVLGWDKNKQQSGGELPQQIPDAGTRDEARLQWESALEHYREALKLNNSNLKTRKNIEVVGSHLQYLTELEEQEKQKEEEDKKKDEEEKKDEPKEDEEKKDKKDDPKDDKKDGDDNKDDQKDGDDKGDQKDDKQNPQDPNKDDQQKDPDQQKQDPGDQKPDDPSNPENGDGSEKDPKQDNGGAKPEDGKPEDGKPEDGKPENGQPENEKPLDPKDQGPPPEDKPAEGDLAANPDQPAQQKPMTPQQARQQQAAAAQQANPQTGYSPSQARQLLKALADENMDVRPIFAPAQAEKFKNW